MFGIRSIDFHFAFKVELALNSKEYFIDHLPVWNINSVLCGDKNWKPMKNPETNVYWWINQFISNTKHVFHVPFWKPPVFQFFVIRRHLGRYPPIWKLRFVKKKYGSETNCQAISIRGILLLQQKKNKLCYWSNSLQI